MATSPMPPASRSQLPELGEFEIAVLDRLWSAPDLSVKEMHQEIGVSRGVTLNTTQSTMDRLYRKGLLSREKQGRAFRYAARVGRADLVGNLIAELLGRFQADSRSALLAFLEGADGIDEKTLQELELALKQRRADAS